MNFCVLLFVVALFCNSYMLADPSIKRCLVAECINSNENHPSPILCSGCVAKALSNSDTALQLHKLQHNLMKEDHSRRKILFSDLDQDVLSLIFDQLGILDTMNFLDIYPAQTLAAAAKVSFWRRYKHFEVYINHKSRAEPFFMSEESKRIKVGTEALALNVLRLFGGVIQRLNVEFSSRSLLQYISKYTSDSLTELTLLNEDYERGITFTLLNKPFNQLKELSLVVTGTPIGNLTFVEMFPQLAVLRLGLRSFNGDYNYFVGGFLHLETLELQIRPIDPDKHVYFEEMLRKSPKIRSLTINSLFPEFSNMLIEHVSNLEFLSVSKIHVQNETRFETVKQLEIRNFMYEQMDHILFPQLEGIFVNYPTWPVNEDNIGHLTRFFTNHANVSKATITVRELDKIELLMQMLYEFHNLVELTLEYNNAYSIEDIPVILQLNQNLVKLNLLNFKIWDWDTANLQNTLANDWNVIENHKNYKSVVEVLSIEKIN